MLYNYILLDSMLSISYNVTLYFWTSLL